MTTKQIDSLFEKMSSDCANKISGTRPPKPSKSTKATKTTTNKGK